MRKRRVTVGVAAAIAGSLVLSVTTSASALDSSQTIGALDVDPSTVLGTTTTGDPAAVAASSSGVVGFPTAGADYLVLSTGRADAILGSASTFLSTNLPGAASGADGNDLTQVRLQLRPPASATCIALDFAFLSEEYPEWVGSSYNDVFTAELNESSFSMSGSQVVAPHNFAYDAEGNLVSVNTVFGMAPVSGTAMDGSTPLLSAQSPVEKRLDGTMDVILSIQDLGDSIYDSAVLVDNVRWLYGAGCTGGIVELTDTDGDGLSDRWETDGIDYDNDGVPELDLPAMGADPQHKDLFLEVDWMVKDDTCIWFICWGGESFAPQQAALDDVRAAFEASPMTNPDGTTGVRVHIDSGPGSVMDATTGATWGARSRANDVGHQESLGSFVGGDYDWSAFDGIKSSHFAAVRQDAFHYVVYADTYGGSGSSGISRGIPGSDLLVTDGHSGWTEGGFTRTQERGTFMHELGHNLDLYHGGGPTGSNNYSPAYLSIMNYAYQLVGLPPASGLDYSRGAPYDDWANIRFDGGSVGDLGDSAPPLTLTPSDSLDAETAKQEQVFARDGDGKVRFVGPSLLLPQTGTQVLQVDVTNVGSVDETYTVSSTASAAALSRTAQAVVPAGQTVRVHLPVDTADLTPGTFPVSLSLSGALLGEQLSVQTGVVTVPDLTDPTVRDAAQQALDELAALPAGSGLDGSVKEQVTEMLLSVVAWDADLSVEGTSAMRQTLKVEPPHFAPSADAPTEISVESAAGFPTTVLAVAAGPGRSAPPVYVGTVTMTTPDGSTVEHRVEAGRWDPATQTFRGAYRGPGGAGGSFSLVVKAPTAGG